MDFPHPNLYVPPYVNNRYINSYNPSLFPPPPPTPMAWDSGTKGPGQGGWEGENIPFMNTGHYTLRCGEARQSIEESKCKSNHWNAMSVRKFKQGVEIWNTGFLSQWFGKEWPDKVLRAFCSICLWAWIFLVAMQDTIVHKKKKSKKSPLKRKKKEIRRPWDGQCWRVLIVFGADVVSVVLAISVHYGNCALGVDRGCGHHKRGKSTIPIAKLRPPSPKVVGKLCNSVSQTEGGKLWISYPQRISRGFGSQAGVQVWLHYHGSDGATNRGEGGRGVSW